ATGHCGRLGDHEVLVRATEDLVLAEAAGQGVPALAAVLLVDLVLLRVPGDVVLTLPAVHGVVSGAGVHHVDVGGDVAAAVTVLRGGHLVTGVDEVVTGAGGHLVAAPAADRDHAARMVGLVARGLGQRVVGRDADDVGVAA